MGDPLNISASVIAILQLTASIIPYFKDAKGAREDCRKALVEFVAIHKLLRLLDESLERLFAHRDEKCQKIMQTLRVPLNEFCEDRVGKSRLYLGGIICATLYVTPLSPLYPVMTLFLHSLREKDLRNENTKLLRKHKTRKDEEKSHVMGDHSDDCEAGGDALKNIRNRVAKR
jgi:hypothetical protein